MEELNSRIRVLEGNSDGEEKETSSSDGGYEKDWRWDNGGWWFRAPLIKVKQSECAIEAVNFQDDKADAESGRQEKQQTRVVMGEFEKGRGSREQFESKQLGESTNAPR